MFLSSNIIISDKGIYEESIWLLFSRRAIKATGCKEEFDSSVRIPTGISSKGLEKIGMREVKFEMTIVPIYIILVQPNKLFSEWILS